MESQSVEEQALFIIQPLSNSRHPVRQLTDQDLCVNPIFCSINERNKYLRRSILKVAQQISIMNRIYREIPDKIPVAPMLRGSGMTSLIRQLAEKARYKGVGYTGRECNIHPKSIIYHPFSSYLISYILYFPPLLFSK